MTAQPLNRLVYCVVVVEFAVNGNQALVRRISASFQYNCAKNGKGLKIGTKETDTRHRSIIGLGAFRKIKYFGDIPRQLFCI